MWSLLLISALAATPSTTARPCHPHDAKDEAFRACFDPGRGVELGADAIYRTLPPGALGASAPGEGVTLEVSAAIAVRGERKSRSRESSRWLTEHRFLDTRLQPSPRHRSMTLTVWEGLFRRHVDEGFILVPTRRPLRLPFPFDVAIAARAFSWERRLFEGAGAHVEVGRAALLLDPVRSESGRFRVGFGPAMSYALRSREPLPSSAWRHELTPFTSALLDVVLESEDGWWSARLETVAGFALVPGEETFFRARGEAHVERLLFAVNDAPFWLRLSVRGAKRDAGVLRRDEVVVGVGLVLRALN